MTHEMRGHYADKHPDRSALDPKIADPVRERAQDGRLSCREAHQLAKELETTAEVIGFHLDVTETRIVRCQLGLFGYAPRKKIVTAAESVPQELESAIRGAMVEGKLPCRSAWDMADRRGLKRMAVAAACEALGIGISPCQLGAFSKRSEDRSAPPSSQ